MTDDEKSADILDETEDDIDDELFDGDPDVEDDDAVATGDIFDDEDVLDDSDPAGDEPEEAETPVPLDVSEDGDDELDGEPAVDLTAIEGLDVDDPLELAEEDDADADDTIREGEFVCSSCHMAKRSSALADADEMLCRDCV